MPDWPRAIDAGLRGVVGYLAAEPAYAHLTIVDAFGASPQTIEIRDELLRAFATYFEPGYDLGPDGRKVPSITAEAVVGGVWQVLHYYVDRDRIEELLDAAPQLSYMLLTPFIGSERAAETALSAPPLKLPAPSGDGGVPSSNGAVPSRDGEARISDGATPSGNGAARSNSAAAREAAGR